jgi:hypothetical protein
MAGESFPDAKAQVAAEVTCEPPMLLKPSPMSAGRHVLTPGGTAEAAILVVGIWLILLTVILLSEGYWAWALLTGAGAVANFGLAWFAYRNISA